MRLPNRGTSRATPLAPLLLLQLKRSQFILYGFCFCRSENKRLSSLSLLLLPFLLHKISSFLISAGIYSGSTYTIFIYMTDRSNWVKVLRKCDREQQEAAVARSSLCLASLSKLYLWPLPTIPVDIHSVCYVCGVCIV